MDRLTVVSLVRAGVLSWVWAMASLTVGADVVPPPSPEGRAHHHSSGASSTDDDAGGTGWAGYPEGPLARTAGRRCKPTLA